MKLQGALEQPLLQAPQQPARQQSKRAQVRNVFLYGLSNGISKERNQGRGGRAASPLGLGPAGLLVQKGPQKLSPGPPAAALPLLESACNGDRAGRGPEVEKKGVGEKGKGIRMEKRLVVSKGGQSQP